MENRVGLNLLYAQVSLELTQNSCREVVTHIPLSQENSMTGSQVLRKSLEYWSELLTLTL